jgi:hypothetical protein
MQSFVRKISPKSLLAKLITPPIVYKMAKQHDGVFYMDCSLLIDPRTGIKYFGEFCSGRPGWDSTYAEIMMARSAHGFFEDICSGVDPLVKDHGAAVRAIDLRTDDEGKDVSWRDQQATFPYGIRKDGDSIKSVNYAAEYTVCFGGAGLKADQAINAAYDALELFSMKGIYYRHRSDMFSQDYPTAILNRLHYMHATQEDIEPPVNIK